jgi:hypothetical protein
MADARTGVGVVLLAMIVVLAGTSCESSWECHYDVTYDNDWSNDVVCRNGFDYVRPSSPLTGATLQEYEDALNAAK